VITLLPESIVEETAHWTLAVNRNQNLLGKLMLVARRPVTSVVELQADEWLELRHEMGRARAALDALFQPDHYNHAFLMNIDAEVRLHIVPRYRADREWSGAVFSDPHYGVLFRTEQRLLDVAALTDLAGAIREQLLHARVR